MFKKAINYAKDHKTAIIVGATTVGAAVVTALLVSKINNLTETTGLLSDTKEIKDLVENNKDGMFIITPKKDLPQNWYLTVDNLDADGKPVNFEDIGHSISDGHNCDFTFIK